MVTWLSDFSDVSDLLHLLFSRGVQLSGEGKFAFVEFRDELMAVTALQLDKKVELAGRPLNVRPMRLPCLPCDAVGLKKR